MPIPTFSYPNFRPYSNVQPFTIRDGATYLMTLESLRDWIRDTLVPHLDAEIAELVTGWESNVTDVVTQFEQISSALIETANGLAGQSEASAVAAEAAKIAAEAARDLAQQYASNAVEAQDGAIADLLDNTSTETRQKLNTLYVAVGTYNALADIINSGRLSEEVLNDRFELKVDLSYLTDVIDTLDATDAGLATRADSLETLTTTGRLGENALDTRYKRVEDIPHAVFIGSSNSTPGTWVEDFASRMGYVAHNYSIGGGSFTGTGAGRFDAQINAAIADTSYAKSLVKYVFVCDLSNDIRATSDVKADAEIVFAKIKNAYPVARIIVLPAIWGNTAANNNGNVLWSISRRYQELMNASLDFDVEIIKYSWTWLADNNVWMKTGEVHPTAAGYARIADFMCMYMRRGGDISYDQGFKFVTAKAGIDPNASYWTAGRSGDLVTVQGNFKVNATQGFDADLGQLDYGLWPMNNVMLSVPKDSDRTTNQAIVIYSNGLIRSFGSLGAANYTFGITYRAF